MSFFNNHVHSEYSNIRLLDAIGKGKKIIDTAVEQGLLGIAFTDHENLSIHPEINEYAKEIREKHPNFVIGLGDEIYLVDERKNGIKYYHFILIAKNKKGHRALNEISSLAWFNMYSDRGMERVPITKDELSEIVNRFPGTLIATTACLGSEISQEILALTKAEKEGNENEIYEHKLNIHNFISYCKDLFGDDFYLECQPAQSKEQIIVNKRFLSIAAAYNVKITVATDAHYINKNDRWVHKSYLNSKGGERETDSFYEYTYMQSPEEVIENLSPSYDKDMIKNIFQTSSEIAQKIEFYDLSHKQSITEVPVKNYPKVEGALVEYKQLSDMYNSDNIQKRYWVNQCVDKLKEKDLYNEKYLARLEEEAETKEIISEKLETNMFAYPITLQHYIDLFWDCGSIVGAGRGCFSPGNKVLMSDGTQRNIENIKVGDTILSAFGNFKKVEKVLEYNCSEKLFTIVPASSSSQEITCTNNHEFWVMEGGLCGYDRRFCSKNCTRKKCKRKASFEKKWKRADELSLSDYIFYPRPKLKEKTIKEFDLIDYIVDKTHYFITEEYIQNIQKKNKIQRKIPINKDFLYVLGVLIGDGWTTFDKNKSIIGIAFNNSTEKDIKSLNICKEYFENIGCLVSLYPHKEKKLTQMYIYSAPLARLFDKLIGHGVENKKIPDCCLYDNFEEMVSLFRGLLASDGHYEKNVLRISYDGINFNLISQIKMLSAYLGIFMSIATRKAHTDNRGFHNKTSYKLRAGGAQLNNFIEILDFPQKFSKSSTSQNLIVEKDGFYFKIKEIKNIEYNGKVYDLTVEEDHCYIVNNVAVHNSSCSGLNHYLLGVTQLDPIKHNLPWFRYMNRERVEIGDIDLDLAPSKRPLIIKKIREERKQYFNEDVPEWAKENLGCVLVATFGTETAKSAILAACRGYRSEECPNGIDVDEAQYISSLVPQERGFLWNLHDVVYGNPDKERKPVAAFVREVNLYPGLLDTMLSIEGIRNKRSSHASGVILFEGDPFENCAFMRTPKGELITQYDLHRSEMLGMTKYDFLVTEIQDKLGKTIELLQKDNVIDSNLSLREAYNKYFEPESLPINEPKYWDAICNQKILNLFQFDSLEGSKGIAKIQPRTIEELSDTNGLIRLMGDGEERPIEKYARQKKDISLWYAEMDRYGLTKEEQKYLEPYFKQSYGVPPSQEQMMLMLMDEHLCGFSLKDANKAREIVGKKKMSEIPALHQKILESAQREVVGRYIWERGVGPQVGYSFSCIHALAYSFIGFQTAFAATYWDSIYWNTACLIVNSGGTDPEKGGSTDYAKTAKAIGDITSEGIKVSLIDINSSQYDFVPDVKNNQILYGLKGLNNVGDDVIKNIIANRPYSSVKDFIEKVKPNKTVMISLIRSGAFDKMENRMELMGWYIWQTCDKKKRLTLQNMRKLILEDLVPSDLNHERAVFEFNRYLKAVCKFDAENYKLDERALSFIENNYLDLFSIVNYDKILNIKQWDKIYQKEMDGLRDWLKKDGEEVLFRLNEKIFKDDWNKYVKRPNYSSWEMESMCFYFHEHELKNINNNKYGLRDYESLSREPIVDKTFEKGGRTIRMYSLCKIIGTVIAKDKNKSVVYLLTRNGTVVPVKFRKDYFTMFDRQISQLKSDGKKKVIEKSWFQRGSMIVVNGMRQEDSFVAKKYASQGGHTLYRVSEIDDFGNIMITSERAKGIEEEGEE